MQERPGVLLRTLRLGRNGGLSYGLKVKVPVIVRKMRRRYAPEMVKRLVSVDT